MTNLLIEKSHVPTIELRPYQDEAANRVEMAHLRGVQRGLVVMATGLGKTVLFADLARREHERGGRTLVIAHRNELLEQAQQKIQAACPSLTVDIDQGSHHATRWSDVIIASIASIGRADSKRLDWFEPTKVVYDEAHHCFCAGTLVDGKPIESLREGDRVRSFNHQTNLAQESVVTRVWKSPATTLIRMSFAGGRKIVCTPDHPFFDGLRYVKATDLSCGVTENEIIRLDRVEILEPGSDGTFGGLCPDGHVYNLTVEPNNNYFVEGLLVHNCAADGAMNATRRFGCFSPGGPSYDGFTATPYRMDNKPLHGSEEAIFQEVLFNYPIKPAVTDGWLSDIRAYRARAGYSLDGIKTTGGDYNAGQLEARVNTDSENYTAFSHWADVASDRQTIVFCAGVQHAKDMAELYNSRGVRAASVDGAMHPDERKAIIGACKAGEIQVLTNCNVCTEGFDWPEVSSVLLLRPTKSWSLFVQMIGRGLRLADGKEDCVVIDIVGSGDDKSLASVPGVLGLPRGLSQDGCSMRDAITSLDDLPDWLKARIMDREFGLDNLDSVLQEVNLLAELDPPDEVIRCSSFAWLKVRDDRYTISCGTDRITGLRRDAVVFADALGQWTAQLFEYCHLNNATHCVIDQAVGNSLADALRRTDWLLQDQWPAVGAVVSVNAPWRKKTSKSERQLYWLRRFGLSNAEIEAMDAGQVSAFLDRKFAARRRR